jgi:hypothetical protein
MECRVCRVSTILTISSLRKKKALIPQKGLKLHKLHFYAGKRYEQIAVNALYLMQYLVLRNMKGWI